MGESMLSLIIFSATSTKNYLLDSFSVDLEESKDTELATPSTSDGSPEVAPQSNIVLRKGIRKIKQGMKRYNSQLTILRQDVRSCRQKAAEQQKLMSEQQKQLAEHQKQIVEYATRMDENEKKNEEISRKFSTLLQELNKCKTELQYWRSKSPATPLFCNSCGNAVLPHQEELEALVNQGVNPEGLGLEPLDFVPIASTSGEPPIPEAEEESVEDTNSTTTVKSDINLPSTSNKKRKIDDRRESKEIPTRSGKKTRRILKGRYKRAKV